MFADGLPLFRTCRWRVGFPECRSPIQLARLEQSVDGCPGRTRTSTDWFRASPATDCKHRAELIGTPGRNQTSISGFVVPRAVRCTTRAGESVASAGVEPAGSLAQTQGLQPRPAPCGQGSAQEPRLASAGCVATSRCRAPSTMRFLYRLLRAPRPVPTRAASGLRRGSRAEPARQYLYRLEFAAASFPLSWGERRDSHPLDRDHTPAPRRLRHRSPRELVVPARFELALGGF